MNALIYMGQILSAFFFSLLYSVFFCVLILLTEHWILSRTGWTWEVIFAIMIITAIFEWIIKKMDIIGVFVYTKTVRKNIISMIVSLGICIYIPSYNIYKLWCRLIDKGTWNIVLAVGLSLILFAFICSSIADILEAYVNNKYPKSSNY